MSSQTVVKGRSWQWNCEGSDSDSGGEGQSLTVNAYVTQDYVYLCLRVNICQRGSENEQGKEVWTV